MAPVGTGVKVAAVAVTVVLLAWVLRDPLVDGRLGDAVRDELTAGGVPVVRDLTPYEGLGTWIDAFDYGAAYQQEGHDPPVSPDDVEDIADAGVRTIYLQANRDDERSPDGWVDEGLVAEFLVRAHEHGLRVVAWYLPTFASVRTDLERLQDLLEYEVDGHRFDGVGVDIELTERVPDTHRRNERLLRLSRQLAEVAGADPVSAIVLPPVLLEVVNPDFWPAFPWAELEPLYDIWLPMAYWTLRHPDSGYQHGGRYLQASTERLRTNLGDGAALVHGIGGIGDEVTGAQLVDFVAALEATDAVGGSIYDWATLSEANRSLLARLFTDFRRG